MNGINALYDALSGEPMKKNAGITSFFTKAMAAVTVPAKFAVGSLLAVGAVVGGIGGAVASKVTDPTDSDVANVNIEYGTGIGASAIREQYAKLVSEVAAANNAVPAKSMVLR